MWAIFAVMIFTITWRVGGTQPMLPWTSPLSTRLLIILAITLVMPASVLVPLTIYRRFRRRWSSTPVGSAEYLISLAAASVIGAVIINFGLRFDPTIRQILNDPRLIDTSIRLFVPLLVFNSVLGTVFARIQREATVTQNALDLVVTQRRLLLESEERVRSQVAAYLHDRVQTDLVSIGLRIRSAVSPGPADMVSEVDAALSDLEGVRADKIRAASRQLSPNLEHVTLEESLRDLAKTYRPAMVVTVSVSESAARELQRGDRVSRSTGLYRICEQGLLNAAIHGHATECSIDVSLTSDDTLVLELTDDGFGMQGDTPKPGMGMTVISAWVESLQGEWMLEPASVGMTLTAVIPVG
jgi:signal transduction histidine kinase